MSKVILPKVFSDQVGPSMAMDVHWIDLKLRDGRTLRKLVLRNRKYITGFKNDPNGVGDLDFMSEDITKVRRTSFLPFL